MDLAGGEAVDDLPVQMRPDEANVVTVVGEGNGQCRSHHARSEYRHGSHVLCQ
jgi:hypothetical protein